MGKKIYSFIGLNFDVDAAITIAAQKEIQKSDPQAFFKFIPKPFTGEETGRINGMNSVDESYAANTENRDPIIFATGCYHNGETFNLLIDGAHRLFKSLYIDESRTVDYVILSVEESLTIASGPMVQFMESYVASKKLMS